MDFEELRALVALAEHGSFLVSARLLNTSRARLRRKLASLEARTGVALLVRSDGKLTTTDAGESLVRGARRLLDEGSLLVAHAREVGTEPTGVLRVGLQVGFPHHLAIVSADLLRKRYPELRTEVRVSENPAELLPGEVDLALCAGDDQEVPDCTEIPIVSMSRQLLASPTYLREHGAPTSVDQVLGRGFSAWRPPSGAADYLPLADGRRIRTRPHSVCSDDRLLRRQASRGVGLVLVPNAPFADPEFPDLQPVLPDVVGQPMAVRLYVPRALENVPRVKAIVDGLRQVTTVG